MDYYSQIARGYDRLHKEEQLKKLAIIRKLLGNIKKSDTLLDIGCGTAFSLDYFSCRRTGVDPSINLLQQAGNPVICARAESLPFRDKSFDYIISVTAIHHFNDAEKAIAEIKRVARGAIVITVLKKSRKRVWIECLLKKNFKILQRVEEERDIVFLLQ